MKFQFVDMNLLFFINKKLIKMKMKKEVVSFLNLYISSFRIKLDANGSVWTEFENYRHRFAMASKLIN